MSRHLVLPLRLGPDGGLATVAEDSVEEVAQSVAVILRTRPGERLAEPELGLADPAFADLPVEALLGAVERWEPRADAEVLEQVLGDDGLRLTTLSLSVDREG